MADQLPAPLVPPEVDLRGMGYMPLKGDRLFGSATWIAASAEAKVAALRLWWRSFAHEVPAGSLPDDDALLADYGGYGVAVKAWRKIKPQAMRGWSPCSDGRLYHRVVCEVALEAWDARQRNRDKQQKWRDKNRSIPKPVTPRVTVTETVTRPSRNAGSEVKESEVKKEVTASPSVAHNARASDFEPVDDAASDADQPWFLKASGRSETIGADWMPSELAQNQLKKSRPDLTPDIVERRMVEFRSWCAANNKTTFNPDATWLGFMVKTHAQGNRNDQSDDSATSRGIDAAFARRSIRTR